VVTREVPVQVAEGEREAAADEAPESAVTSSLEYIPAVIVPAEEEEEGEYAGTTERPRSFAEAFPPMLQGRRARWIAGVAALALLGAGGAGFAMGRGARTPESGSVAALAQSPREVVEEPQAGSIQPTGQMEAAAPAPAPHVTRRRAPAIPDWDPSTPTTTRSARIPSRSHARRLTSTMERLGNKVMAGANVKADSIGRTVELPPPTFDKP
jgi:hypothetical protein